MLQTIYNLKSQSNNKQKDIFKKRLHSPNSTWAFYCYQNRNSVTARARIFVCTTHWYISGSDTNACFTENWCSRCFWSHSFGQFLILGQLCRTYCFTLVISINLKHIWVFTQCDAGPKSGSLDHAETAGSEAQDSSLTLASENCLDNAPTLHLSIGCFRKAFSVLSNKIHY